MSMVKTITIPETKELPEQVAIEWINNRYSLADTVKSLERAQKDLKSCSYTVKVTKTKSGKKILKVNLDNAIGGAKATYIGTGLDSFIMQRIPQRNKHLNYIKLDENNLLENEMIKNRKKQIVRMARALG